MMGLSDIPLFERLCWAQENLEPYHSDYRVVFESDVDEPAAILVPAPEWMACALHGGILPPVEVYHRLEIDDVDGRILNGHILHGTPPLGPMTEEQAIEYLIKKDIPPSVWRDERANHRKFVICKKHQIPSDRDLRNAWSLAA